MLPAMANNASRLDLQQRQRLGLDWLIRLRWIAVAGQIGTCLAVWLAFRVDLPVTVLGASIGLTTLTNLALESSARLRTASPRLLCGLAIALDTLVLTVMLYWCGGAHNPFTAFYLLHVTIAAILLPPLWTWFSMLLAATCYGVLFTSPFALQGSLAACCGSFSLHLQGMLLAMILSGGCIAFFVSKLRRALDAQEIELARARAVSERNERFASLATLAAGMAHELATPLGTIAIASKELERFKCASCHTENSSEDARLIRAEVERCRLILEKLADRSTGGIESVPEKVSLRAIPVLLEDYLKFEHRPRVSYEINDDGREIVVPEVPLLQALAIVIKNGLEASPGSQRVKLHIAGNVEGVTFSVHDKGQGMPPEIARRIGEPFFTTKEPGEGVGLGLFLVRTFVERVQGRFTMESQPSLGTTMNIFIPWEMAARTA